MGNISYYTEEGLEKLKAELQELKVQGRARIAQEISDARDKGDLSENAEYDAAKEAQGILESKIKKLEQVVGNARILSEKDIDTSKVSILSKVEIKNKAGKIFHYNIVAETEADVKSGKISVNSPIAQGLLGKRVGEVAIVTTPSGKLEFEIYKIGL